MGTNRRDFLKTLGGVALFSIVPRHVLGNGYIAPSDQLTKGIIGTGGMGRGHLNYGGTRLVAVCDVDKNHLELGKNLVKEKIGVKVRSVELNVLQRCSSAMLSGTDQKEAIASGAYGVKCAIEGATGKMVAFRRLPGEDYRTDYVLEDVNAICNQEKTVPAEWITKDGSDVGREFTAYALPLIQGEVKVPSENGLPLFAYR